MEKSKYTIEINQNGKIELINTLYGSIIELDKENLLVFNEILDNKIHKNEIDLLLQEGIIVKSRKEEELMLKQAHDNIIKDKEILNLVIFATTACNMQCVYCFQHLHPIFPKEGNIEMIMNFIKNCHINYPLKHISITWFGGEPLLNLDYIRKLSTEVITFSIQKSIEYNATMITNGILLTKEIATELKTKYNVISVQITLDGLACTHNKRRPYGGKDGFSIIINNIIAVHKIIGIVLRINIDIDNLHEVEALLYYLSKCEDINEDILVNFARVIGENPSCMTASDFGNERLLLNKLLAEYKFTNTLKNFSLKGRLLSCSVLTENSFVIYPNGDLYKCYEVAGDAKYCIGNISTFAQKYENLISDNFKLKQDCIECSMLPLCNRHICPLNYGTGNTKCPTTLTGIENTLEIIEGITMYNE